MESVKPWIGSKFVFQAGNFTLSDRCLEGVNGILRLLKENPMPFLILSSNDSELPHFLNLSKQIREILNRGLGFFIRNKLPVVYMSESEATNIYYWLLTQLVGGPVGQKWSYGRMIYSVTDLGCLSGNGVRPDVTTEE